MVSLRMIVTGCFLLGMPFLVYAAVDQKRDSAAGSGPVIRQALDGAPPRRPSAESTQIQTKATGRVDGDDGHAIDAAPRRQ
jgi:hypothetical protein